MSTHLRALTGCAALAAYLALFSAGMFIDSKPYRDRLSGGASPLNTALSGEALILPAVSAAPPARIGVVEAFVASVFLYTPTNVAVLTLLAGFLGGCASNMTFGRGGWGKAQDAAADPDDRAVGIELIHTESPFASMFRSFLVYLAFITGIFITTSEPFQNPTAEQYVRFAGTISLFAFVVGYDPTKFQDFLDFLPRRGGKTNQ